MYIHSGLLLFATSHTQRIEMTLSCPFRDKFCFVCGMFAPPNHMHQITENFELGYEDFFDKVVVPTWYKPNVSCDYCYRCMVAYHSGSDRDFKKHMIKYSAPVQWLPRSEHVAASCYFCQSNTFGFNYMNRERIRYAELPSVIPAELRTGEEINEAEEPLEEQTFGSQAIIMKDASEQQVVKIEVSASTVSPSAQQLSTSSGDASRRLTESTNRSSTLSSIASVHSEYIPSDVEANEQHLITNSDYEDIKRLAKMAPMVSESIASRLVQWKLVAHDFKITSTRKRSNRENLDECFDFHESTKITYCVDIDSLFECLNHTHVPEEWRLFIDSSVESLKAVLLHIGNKYPSVPIAYGREVKENYDTMKLILELINYDLHAWKICCDLKIVSLLTGVKGGYSKQQCFLCLWEGRLRHLHYTDHRWKPRVTYQLGIDSIDHMPLVPASKIILPPLHIKLGLVRNLVRAIKSNNDAFELLKAIFPRLTAAKVDNGELFCCDIGCAYF